MTATEVKRMVDKMYPNNGIVDVNRPRDSRDRFRIAMARSMIRHADRLRMINCPPPCNG